MTFSCDWTWRVVSIYQNWDSWSLYEQQHWLQSGICENKTAVDEGQPAYHHVNFSSCLRQCEKRNQLPNKEDKPIHKKTALNEIYSEKGKQ